MDKTGVAVHDLAVSASPCGSRDPDHNDEDDAAAAAAAEGAEADVHCPVRPGSDRARTVRQGVPLRQAGHEAEEEDCVETNAATFYRTETAQREAGDEDCVETNAATFYHTEPSRAAETACIDGPRAISRHGAAHTQRDGSSLSSRIFIDNSLPPEKRAKSAVDSLSMAQCPFCNTCLTVLHGAAAAAHVEQCSALFVLDDEED